MAFRGEDPAFTTRETRIGDFEISSIPAEVCSEKECTVFIYIIYIIVYIYIYMAGNLLLLTRWTLSSFLLQ